DVNRDRERQSDEHATRVDLDGLLEEVADVSERRDVVVPIGDLASAQAENGRVDVHVLSAGKLGIETSAKLEKPRHSPVDLHSSERRSESSADDLQQGGLPRSVPADDSQRLALADSEGHIA